VDGFINSSKIKSHEPPVGLTLGTSYECVVTKGIQGLRQTARERGEYRSASAVIRASLLLLQEVVSSVTNVGENTTLDCGVKEALS